MARLLSAAALAFLLVGCADGEPEPSGDAGSSPRSGGGAVDSQAAPVAGELPAPGDATVSLALEGDGLRVFIAPAGGARPFPFGTAMDVTMEVLGGALYGAPVEEGENAECAVHYASWENGLTVWSADGRFVGWSVRDGSGTLTTATGVGPGSTRAEWEESYVVQQFNSTLGAEFTAGGMAGVLESTEPDARVVNLWAGQVCIAR